MIANIGKAVGGEAVSTAKAKAADQRESAKNSAATARLQAVEWQDVAHDFIKQQPALSLGIAASLGHLAGYMDPGYSRSLIFDKKQRIPQNTQTGAVSQNANQPQFFENLNLLRLHSGHTTR